MNALSIPVLMMAGISFYVGSYHLITYLRRRQHRQDLTFALLCLANGLYDLFCFGLYNASSVAEGAAWQKAQFIALACFSTAFLWFMADFTRRRPGPVAWIFSAFYLAAAVVQLVDRTGLTFALDQPSIKEIALPLGLRVTYFEAALGPFTVVQGVIGLAFTAYIVGSGIVFFIRGDRKRAGPLLAALALMTAAAVNDNLVSNGLYHFMYLIEYSFQAMIIVMAFALSDIIIEAAAVREALRASEERFRSLVETSSDWVWETDRDGVYTYSSPRSSELLGFAPEEIVGRTLWSFSAPEEAARLERVFREAAGERRSLERWERPVRRRDGSPRVLESNGAPFCAERGGVSGFRGIDRDVTERHQAETALRQARLVIEQSPVVLFCWAAAPGWPVTFVSANVRQFGYEAGEFLSGAVTYAAFVHPDDRERTVREVEAYAAGGAESFVQEYRIITKQGEARWVDDRTVIERDERGAATLFQGIIVDITVRKAAEDEVKRLNAALEARVAERTAQLESALKELEAFSYSVSHDLRAPLRAMHGYARLLVEEHGAALPTDGVRLAEAIGENSRFLGRLVDGLLNFARLGRAPLNEMPLSMREVAEEALESLEAERPASGAKVEIDDLPDSRGDPLLVRQVWYNLLSNAFKFSRGAAPQAIISIGFDTAGGEPAYFVKDNGVGFDMKHAGKLFGVFQRLHSSAEFEGTGIGLAIVQRIVNRHGGRVWATASPGEGAEFFFTLGGAADGH